MASQYSQFLSDAVVPIELDRLDCVAARLKAVVRLDASSVDAIELNGRQRWQGKFSEPFDLNACISPADEFFVSIRRESFCYAIVGKTVGRRWPNLVTSTLRSRCTGGHVGLRHSWREVRPNARRNTVGRWL